MPPCFLPFFDLICNTRGWLGFNCIEKFRGETSPFRLQGNGYLIFEFLRPSRSTMGARGNEWVAISQAYHIGARKRLMYEHNQGKLC